MGMQSRRRPAAGESCVLATVRASCFFPLLSKGILRRLAVTVIPLVCSMHTSSIPFLVKKKAPSHFIEHFTNKEKIKVNVQQFSSVTRPSKILPFLFKEKTCI
jgi:hypothetical protein